MYVAGKKLAPESFPLKGSLWSFQGSTLIKKWKIQVRPYWTFWHLTMWY